LKLFVEGDNECTSERVWGQFSIFGAVEENLRCELGGIRGDEEFVEEIRLSRVPGGRSVRWKAAEEDAGTGEDGLSTETAQEMQKGFRLVATGNPRRTTVKVGILRLRGRFAFAKRPLR